MSARGEMPEWPNGIDSKSIVAAMPPRVRIPVSPPHTKPNLLTRLGFLFWLPFWYAIQYAIWYWLTYYPDGLHWTPIQSGAHILMMFTSLSDYINQGNVALALSEIAPATAEGKPHDYLLSFHPDVISSAKSRRERTFEQSRQSLSDGAMVSV